MRAFLMVLLFPLLAYGNFQTGEALQHNLSVCIQKADAIEIVQAEIKSGLDAARAKWNEKQQCATVPVVGHAVGNVVFSADLVREGEKITMRVVEIVSDEGKVLAYFFTTQAVLPRKAEARRGGNA